MLNIIAVFCYATVIGGIAASAGILFIDAAAAATAYYSGIGLLIAPVVGGVVCATIARLLPAGVFLGLADMVLQVQRGNRHRLRHHLLATLASFTALCSGVSVGQYGPVAHLGGAFATFFNRLSPTVATACGVAAAIAAAFNAPLTAIVFVHEVILRHYSLRAFTPVAISAVIGYSVSVGLFNRPLFLALPSMPSMPPTLIALFILMGFVFGILAAAYVRGIFRIADSCRRLSLYTRLPIAGLITGLLAFSVPEISGGGQLLLAQTISAPSATIALALFSAKIIATIICLGAGFAGGVVSPTLAIGALAGLLFYYGAAELIPTLPIILPAAAAALCGMMALTAPVIGAPLAGILFTMELSGSYPVAIIAAVTIAVAVQVYARLGGQSFYDLQLRQRGVDIRLRQDEWRLATETIATLVQPPVQAGAVMSPTVALATAISQAIAGQHSVIYIADVHGKYGGCILLTSALSLPVDKTTYSLQAAVERVKQPPVLSPHDTIANAIKKLQYADGAALAVIDDDTVFLGLINEGIVLHRYHQIIASYRAEETAVS